MKLSAYIGSGADYTPTSSAWQHHPILRLTGRADTPNLYGLAGCGKMSDRARVLIFTGDGKGKTTAALGMVLRACGHGMRVRIIQFVKNDSSTGENAAIDKLPNVEIVQMGLGFVPTPEDERFAGHRAAAEAALAHAREVITSGDYEMVVLDEVCFAVCRGLLDEKKVLEVVKSAPPHVCLALTGSGASEELIAAADTVTEMHNIKHALAAGRSADKGVEM